MRIGRFELVFFKAIKIPKALTKQEIVNEDIKRDLYLLADKLVTHEDKIKQIQETLKTIALVLEGITKK